MKNNNDKNQFRALIVSEKPHECDIYIEQFKAWNSDICATTDLNEAAKVVEALGEMKLPINVIVLDQEHVRPEQLNFIQQVREQFTFNETQIIIVGSEKFIAYSEQQFAPELADIFSKPCAPSKLEAAVEHILDQQNVLATAPAQQETKQTPVEYGIDVLIAEDNEVNQIVFTEILNEMGVQYQIANNGQEAVDLWKQHKPALILMDVSMPVMNGHEATREIRRCEDADNLQPTPICAITAHALKGDKEDCFAAGMNDYLSKPISPDMMTDKIKTMLPAGHKLLQGESGSVAA